MEPIAIDPERSLTIKLPARMWNVVNYALNKHPMPFETSAPVISALNEQLREQATQPLTTEEMLARTNTEGGAYAEASRVPRRSEPMPHTDAGDDHEHRD